MASTVRPCPTCEREVAPRPENPFFPFCQERCKAVDLGRWLGGEFRIPVESEDEVDDQDLAAKPPLADA
jgi:uncharacterized protein